MYDASFRIIIFGDESPGKKTLTQRYLTNLFESDQTMSIGVDYLVKSLSVDGQKVKLQIWDFGGEERFRFLFPTYTRGALGGLFLYDVSNYSTLAHMGDWLSIIIRKELKAEERFPILAVGIVHDEGLEREISAEEGKKMAKLMKLDGFIECNLQTGKNVEETFEALTRLILAQPRFCHKCQKEFMFGEFLKHPCFTAGDVKYSGAIDLRGIIRRKLMQGFLKQAKSKNDIAFEISSLDHDIALEASLLNHEIALEASLLNLLPTRFWPLENSKIIAAALVQRDDTFLRSTDKWDINDDLIKFLSGWNSIKAKSINISGVNYAILHSSMREFVTTPKKGENYIVGTKFGGETLLLYLKPNGKVAFDPAKHKFDII